MTDATLDLTPSVAPAVTPAGAPAEHDRPRTRWAAIVWGLVFAAIASTALWVTVDAGRRDAVADWVLALSPAAATAYVLLALGALTLVLGAVGIARRLQRGSARRSAASVDPAV